MARVVVIGTSVLGRPIRATEIGNPDASFKVVVVGCIHGNESAGIAITSQLKGQRPFGTVDLWVIDDLNPDGVAAGTRQNAHGVDLNRNFPYRWQPLGRPGDVQYSGPSPLSEPESRAAVAFLAHVRPSVVVWFHQQSNLVDNSGGDPAIERRFAQTIGLAHRQLARYPGSATGWENHYDAASTAFVVELPAGRADAALIQRALNAILEIKPQL